MHFMLFSCLFRCLGIGCVDAQKDVKSVAICLSLYLVKVWNV